MVYYFFRLNPTAENMADREDTYDEDIKANEKMVNREDLSVEDKRAVDIETIKAIKKLMLQMKPLYGQAFYDDEAAFKCDLLSDKIRKFKIMTLTDEEIMKLLNEED